MKAGGVDEPQEERARRGVSPITYTYRSFVISPSMEYLTSTISCGLWRFSHKVTLMEDWR